MATCAVNSSRDELPPALGKTLSLQSCSSLKNLLNYLGSS